MNEKDMQETILKIVAISCEDLTDTEIAVLYMTATWQKNFRGKLGAEKIESLLNSDGTMHDETLKAFLRVAGNRLQEIQKNK